MAEVDPGDESSTGERKTLHQQLQDNAEQKRKEIQDEINQQNASYKLNDKTIGFYKSLKQQELVGEFETKQTEQQELERYRDLKSKSKQNKIKESKTNPTDISSSVEIGLIVRKRVSTLGKGQVKKAKAPAEGEHTQTTFTLPETNRSTNTAQKDAARETKAKDAIVTGYSSSEEDS